MFIGIVLLAIVAVTVVAVVAIYNRLVTLKNAVLTGWSNIDVVLQQRHDELPKLVTICKEYMKHERETLESVIAARNAVHAANRPDNVRGLGAAETGLRARVAKLFAIAEAYPDLKASTLFLQLQKRITGLETSIADRRELYNDKVNLHNTGIEQFPAVLIAGMFGFEPRQLLQFEAAHVADIDIGGMLNGGAQRAAR